MLKLASYRLIDLAKAIVPNAEIEFTGNAWRKIHEEMISYTESANTIEYKNHFVILPSFRDYSLNDYIKKLKGEKLKSNFLIQAI